MSNVTTFLCMVKKQSHLHSQNALFSLPELALFEWVYRLSDFGLMDIYKICSWKQEQMKGYQEMLILETSLIKWLYPLQVLAVMMNNVTNKYSEEGSDSNCPGEKGD